MSDHQPNTARIRRLLNSAFDDPGLDAFCQDYFPSVYDTFGRGMQKGEKITLLLDHCRRTSKGFETLRQAAWREYEASDPPRNEFKALAEAIGSPEQESSKPAPRNVPSPPDKEPKSRLMYLNLHRKEPK